jgi:O-antigen/teichoic acid export membrane protein
MDQPSAKRPDTELPEAEPFQAELPDAEPFGEKRSSDQPRPAAKRGSYRSGFVFGVLGFLVVATIGVVSTILTSRLYGVRIIGEFALVSAPVGALWVLSTVKEQQALIREIARLPPRHPRVSQLFAAVFTFSTGLTAGMALLDAVVCWFVFRGPLHQPDLVAPALVSLAGYALVTNTCWNLDSVLSAFVAGRAIFWVRLHEAVSFVVLAVAIGLAWRSVWGLVIATIGASLTSLVHRLLEARGYARGRISMPEYRLGMKALPELLRFGLKATPGQIALGVSQQGGVWAVGLVAPIGVVGAYSRALTIPQRLQQVSNRVTEVLYPTLVGRHTKGDGEGFDRALIDSIRYETVGMLLLAAAFGGAAQSVMKVFGPGFGRAAPALALLMLYPVLASITSTQTQALWATNQPARTSVNAFVRLGVTLTLLIVLTPRIGIIGPAIALLAGLLALSILNGAALRHHLSQSLRVTWPRRERLVLAAAYLIGFAAARAVEHELPSIGGLLCSLTAGTLAYAAVFLAGGAVNQRDRHRIREAIAMVRSRRERAAAGGAAQMYAAEAVDGG